MIKLYLLSKYMMAKIYDVFSNVLLVAKFAQTAKCTYTILAQTRVHFNSKRQNLCNNFLQLHAVQCPKLAKTPPRVWK